MAKKIYLSAAAHLHDNLTKCPGKCGENIHCNAYMDIVEKRLKDHKFETMRGDKSKVGGSALQSRVAQANKWGADTYYVAHTNADGKNGATGASYSLTMIFPGAANLERARVFHKYRKCVPSHKITTREDLYEIRATKMPCIYDELFFHDNEAQCKWFHNGGMVKMAEETVQALCEIHGVTYKPLKYIPKKGDKITLKDDTLYTSSTAKKGKKRSGTYYIYDGIAVNGRYRITNKPTRVGKKPAALNVTGWVKL